jgi:hypothetical protein
LANKGHGGPGIRVGLREFHGLKGQLLPFAHLEACQQADVTRCATNAFLRTAVRSVLRREFGPLAPELLPRLLFISYAALGRLIDGESGGSGHVEFATPCNIELRHSVSHCNDQLRVQNYHRN